MRIPHKRLSHCAKIATPGHYFFFLRNCCCFFVFFVFLFLRLRYTQISAVFTYSPNLVPNINGFTSTGLKIRPLCTQKICPFITGNTLVGRLLATSLYSFFFISLFLACLMHAHIALLINSFFQRERIYIYTLRVT